MITNMAVNQNFTVGVFIQNSDPMHGFDIYVRVNNGIISPIKAVLGPLIKSPSSTTVCINGGSAQGTCTLGTVNGAGVVEVSTIESGTANECPSAPCSGLAFNITYNVRQATGSTPIDYPSASTCSPSSVPGTDICIIVTDNTGTPVGENTESATYGAPTPTFLSVVVGTDNGLYWSGMYSGASSPCCWSLWKPLSGLSPSAPYLCPSGPGGVELVVRGYDNNIYHKSFSAGTWSASWDKNPTGITIDQPVCAVLGSTMHVVVRGGLGSLEATSFNLTDRTWAPWTDLQLNITSVPALTVTPLSAFGSPILDLVVRGSNNGIYHKAFFSGAWAAKWDTAGPPSMVSTIDTPTVSSLDGFFQVIIRDPSNVLFHATGFTDFTGKGVWSNFVFLSGSTPVAPTIVTDSSGIFHVVVRAFDNQVEEKATTINCGNCWDTPWSSSAGQTANRPAAAAAGPTLGVVVSGLDSQLWYNSFDGITWSGWLILGGLTRLDPSLVAVP